MAIAGILAMKPDCIILDEPTAMLDPVGRKEVISTVTKLNRQEGKTVILITHFMQEAVCADRVLVMEKGRIVMEGKPNEIFSQVEKLKQHGLMCLRSRNLPTCWQKTMSPCQEIY